MTPVGASIGIQRRSGHSKETVVMLSIGIQASLAEVIEVRDGLLLENEALAVLKTTTVALQNLFRLGRACSERRPRYLLAQETLMLCHDGQIRLASKPSFLDAAVIDSQRQFIPVECFSHAIQSTEAIEKTTSPLSSTLELMCSQHALTRPSLTTLMSICDEDETCSTEACKLLIEAMHGSVFGSNLNFPCFTDDFNNVHEDLRSIPQVQTDSAEIESESTSEQSDDLQKDESIDALQDDSNASISDGFDEIQPCDSLPNGLEFANSDAPLSVSEQGSQTNSTEFIDSSRLIFSKNSQNKFGAEFTRLQPAISLFLPNTRYTDEAQLCPVELVLLNGVRLNVVCRVDCTGRQLYDFVTQYLVLSESGYFGLTYIHDGEHFFIDDETKLHKVAPVDWKKPLRKGCRQESSFVTYFRVKFFVDDLTLLRQPVSRHLVYLQLRQDTVVDGKLSCSDDQAVTLAALALRAEYGGRLDLVRYAVLTHYVTPQTLLRLKQHSVGEQLIINEYLQLAHLSEEDAELRFIKKAIQLPEYGIYFYQINKNSRNSDKLPVLLGVSSRGVLIAERRGTSVLVVTESFWWKAIEKIAFNRHRFAITLKPTGSASTQKPGARKLKYHIDSQTKGQYLMKFCKENHNFQMLSRSKPAGENLSVVDFVEGDSMSNSSITSQEILSVSMQSLNFRNTIQRLSSSTSLHIDTQPNYSISGELKTTDEFVDSSVSPVCIETPDESRSETDIEPISSFTQRVHSGTANGSKKHTRSSLPALSIVKKAQLLTSSKQNATNIESQIVQVVLTKADDSSAGFGFGIVPSTDSTKTPSVLRIAYIVRGGVADQDGRLQTGDELVTVNGYQVAGLSQRALGQMIRSHGNVIKIVVSRTRSSEQSNNRGKSNGDENHLSLDYQKKVTANSVSDDVDREQRSVTV